MKSVVAHHFPGANGEIGGRLVTLSVNLTVVGAAERHRILVADFAVQGPRLHEAEVMGLGGLPLAPKLLRRLICGRRFQAFCCRFH
jgi:hypothetical protein